jgi:hypothetical protein
MIADKLKGAALILAFLGVIATCAAWIQIRDSTWQAAVEPTGAFAMPSLILDMVAVGGLSLDIDTIRAGQRGRGIMAASPRLSRGFHRLALFLAAVPLNTRRRIRGHGRPHFREQRFNPTSAVSLCA